MSSSYLVCTNRQRQKANIVASEQDRTEKKTKTKYCRTRKKCQRESESKKHTHNKLHRPTTRHKNKAITILYRIMNKPSGESYCPTVYRKIARFFSFCFSLSFLLDFSEVFLSFFLSMSRLCMTLQRIVETSENIHESHTENFKNE